MPTMVPLAGPSLRPSWHLRQFVGAQVKHQHFGVFAMAQADLAFVPYAYTVAFLQALAVKLNAAARHMDVGVAIRCQFQAGTFVSVEQAGIHPRVLAHFQRTVGTLWRDDQLQAPTLLRFSEMLLLIARFGAGF